MVTFWKGVCYYWPRDGDWLGLCSSPLRIRSAPFFKLALWSRRCSGFFEEENRGQSAPLVEIASLIFCRCSQRGSQLRFLAAYHKAVRHSGGAPCITEDIWRSDLSKRRSWASGSTLSPMCPGQVECGASAVDQWRGEHHEYGLCSSTLLSKRKVLISTEVRRECYWPGSHCYLDFFMGIDGEKKMFLQTQPYPLARLIISFTQSICILY